MMLACVEVTDLIDCNTSNRSREIVEGDFVLAGPFVDSWEIVSISLFLSRVKRFPPKKLILMRHMLAEDSNHTVQERALSYQTIMCALTCYGAVSKNWDRARAVMRS